MKRGLSTDAFAATVARGEADMLDMLRPSKEFTLEADYSSVPEGGAPLPVIVDSKDGTGYHPTKNAHGQLAEITGIRSRYYNKMLGAAPNLLATNVNHWLDRDDKLRMLRATKSGRLRAVLSNSYRRIDNFQIAKMVIPILHDIPGMEIMAMDVSEDYMRIYATTPRKQTELRRGDIVQAYVGIRNSETGNGSVRVEPGVLKLTCLNGQTMPDHRFKMTHLGRRLAADEDMAAILSSEAQRAFDQALMLELRDKIQFALTGDALEVYAEKMQALIPMEITGDPAAAIGILGKKVGFTEDEGARVLRNLINGGKHDGGATAFGLLNAVTALAHDVESFDRAAEYEEMGGKIITLKKSEWTSVLKAEKAEKATKAA